MNAMKAKAPKKQAAAVKAHPKGRGREHVEQSHDLKKVTSKAPTLPKRFSHTAIGNR